LIDGWQLALTAPGSVNAPDALPSTLEWMAAIVPGTAAQALQAAGRWSLERPEPLHDKDIWYRARIRGDGARMLRFGGLATLAEVWLNGSKILTSDNMFLMHDVDVVLAGDNELVMVFRSLDRALAAKKGRARWRTRLVENNALRFVRTTLLGHMTGWAPAAHAVGPWRPIEFVDAAPDADLHATLDGNDGVLVVSLRARMSAKVTVAGKSVALSLASPGRFEGRVELPGIEKWWPHTHGAPALHRVQAEIDGTQVELGQVGFRSLAVDRGADGRGFTLIVNGQPVFARGACWSASDPVSLAGDRAALRPWLELARDAHMNMIRVGGTMVYESGDFFALCDELGILVWHDFMFANMDYPIADPAFRSGIEAEAKQFLDRTRGHPSLTVLCGGSEVAQQVAMMGLPHELWSGPLYDEVLPAFAKARRPDAIYVPNSPCGGDLPFSTDAGISHYYGVGAYLRPLDDARRAGVRFTSECLGFANLPNDCSPGNVPRDRGADWDFADVTRHYAHMLYGADAKHLLRAAPAEVMEAVIAEWRRAGSSCGGALVWMLKDFVPGAGWGVIDSSGAPKLAWHGLRRAFRPVQVAITDEGLNGLAIHLINESAATVRAKLVLRCYQNSETVVMRRDRDVELPPRSNQTLSSAALIGSFFDITHAYRFGPAALDVTAITLDDAATGLRLADAAHFPLGRGGLRADPDLSVETVGGDKLKIRATRFAACVQVTDAGWRVADEGFNLLPGEERIVQLIRVAGTAEPAGTVRATNGENEVRYASP
jgi:beta-mannosidase